jgi:hypothetical protein
MNWNECFTYEPETGAILWKERPRSHFKSDSSHKRMNTVLAGKVAGYFTETSPGYFRSYINVGGKMRLTHRIIWEMCNGPIPDSMLVDHIDNDATNNRLSNLRLATKAQNGMNRASNKNSSTGLKGVSQDKRDGAWQAEIRANGRRINLGRHLTKGLAAVAYAKAAVRYHGEFARTTAKR